MGTIAILVSNIKGTTSPLRHTLDVSIHSIYVGPDFYPAVIFFFFFTYMNFSVSVFFPASKHPQFSPASCNSLSWIIHSSWPFLYGCDVTYQLSFSFAWISVASFLINQAFLRMILRPGSWTRSLISVFFQRSDDGSPIFYKEE